jgi:hypothetical protein
MVTLPLCYEGAAIQLSDATSSAVKGRRQNHRKAPQTRGHIFLGHAQSDTRQDCETVCSIDRPLLSRTANPRQSESLLHLAVLNF